MHPVNADADKLAMQGYCPVSYHFGPPAEGDPAITRERNGAVYRFGSKAAKGMFDVEPTKYTPLYGCYCAYGMSMGGLAPIDPLNFLLIDGKLHLFGVGNTKPLWEVTPPASKRQRRTGPTRPSSNEVNATPRDLTL